METFTQSEVDDAEETTIRDAIDRGFKKLEDGMKLINDKLDKSDDRVKSVQEEISVLKERISDLENKKKESADGSQYRNVEEREAFTLEDSLVSTKRMTFVTVEYDGITQKLELPETLIFQLKALNKERPIILALLKHLFTVTFLRKCTLTGLGASKSKTEDELTPSTRIVLPAEKVALIEAAVMKLLPVTDDAETELGKKIKKQQKQVIRTNIRSCLQYFRDEYDERGNKIPKIKKRKHALDDGETLPEQPANNE